MQVENYTFSSQSQPSSSRAATPLHPLLARLHQTISNLLNSPSLQSLCSSLGFYSQKRLPVTKPISYFAALLALLVSYIGMTRECSCGSYSFLISWTLLFMGTRTNPKNFPSLNLFMFVWGHCQLVTGQHCSYPATLSIVCILLTNIELYFVLTFVVGVMGIAVVGLVAALVEHLRDRPEVRKRREREIIIENLKVHGEIGTPELCSVCFEGKLDCKLRCGHHFHIECIRNWLRIKVSCPICRSELL